MWCVALAVRLRAYPQKYRRPPDACDNKVWTDSSFAGTANGSALWLPRWRFGIRLYDVQVEMPPELVNSASAAWYYPQADS